MEFTIHDARNICTHTWGRLKDVEVDLNRVIGDFNSLSGNQNAVLGQGLLAELTNCEARLSRVIDELIKESARIHVLKSQIKKADKDAKQPEPFKAYELGGKL